MKKLVALVALCLAPLSFAQTKPAPSKPPPAKEIVFGDGEGIIGEADGPDAALFEEPAPVKHSSLIRVREDFTDKVLRSAQDLP